MKRVLFAVALAGASTAVAVAGARKLIRARRQHAADAALLQDIARFEGEGGATGT